jgi:hypothetical protein
MKRIPFTLLTLLVLAVLVVPVWAQMHEYMHERGAEAEGETPGHGPGWGCYGYGMGPGMMGPGYGYGMGPGMMGPGYGYGMGPGMMGPGYGYGMGPGYGGYGWMNSKEAKEFLDATRDLRKKLHAKMFDYMEMVRSGASDEKLEAASKEIDKLRMELYNKAKEMMK